MFELPTSKLQQLRDRLQQRGERRSIVRQPLSSRDLAEAVAVVEEYGPLCDILYLMMAADRRVLNVERQVMKGALDVLSGGRVKTAHLEALLDGSARRVAELGEERCLERALERLEEDPVRAEVTVLLAAAVALADGALVPEEQVLLGRLAAAFRMDQAQAAALLDELNREPEPDHQESTCNTDTSTTPARNT